jgi:hypothetical protein
MSQSWSRLPLHAPIGAHSSTMPDGLDGPSAGSLEEAHPGGLCELMGGEARSASSSLNMPARVLWVSLSH